MIQALQVCKKMINSRQLICIKQHNQSKDIHWLLSLHFCFTCPICQLESRYSAWKQMKGFLKFRQKITFFFGLGSFARQSLRQLFRPSVMNVSIQLVGIFTASGWNGWNCSRADYVAIDVSFHLFSHFRPLWSMWQLHIWAQPSVQVTAGPRKTKPGRVMNRPPSANYTDTPSTATAWRKTIQAAG